MTTQPEAIWLVGAVSTLMDEKWVGRVAVRVGNDQVHMPSRAAREFAHMLLRMSDHVDYVNSPDDEGEEA